MDMIIENLKAATGWERVYLRDTAYVIDFSIKDFNLIRGVARNNDTFYMTAEEFTTVPVSFRVSKGDAVFQYWTLNRHLHRIGDRPAKVIYTHKNRSLIRYWYRHGLLHRDAGPAIDKIFGLGTSDLHPETNADLGVNFTIHTWSKRSMEYFYDGLHRAFPHPIRVHFQGHGYEVVRPFQGKNETRLFQEWKLDCPDGPAISGAHVIVEWSPVRHHVLPSKMTLNLLDEYYKEGVFEKRTVGELSTLWVYRDDLVNNPKMDEELCDGMMNDYGLLFDPFFRSSVDEMIFYDEFKRGMNE